MAKLTEDEEKIIEAMERAMREADLGLGRIETYVSIGHDGQSCATTTARTDAAYFADARRQYAAHKAMTAATELNRFLKEAALTVVTVNEEREAYLHPYIQVVCS
jgi:hypothetical protein